VVVARPQASQGAMADRGGSDGMPKPAVVSPGWPQERYANGVVSYTAEIVAGMRRIGAQPHVASFDAIEGGCEDFVSHVRDRYSRRGRAMRGALAALGKICPHLLAFRLAGASLLFEIRRLADAMGVNICEIEEAHGTAGYLTCRSPIPVVVRLHGPWFLSGASLGVRQDRAFWRRVKREGRGIAQADGVTAPSRSVLESVRSFYGFALEDAEVIPNPAHPVAAHERWSGHECEPDRILYVGRFDRTKGGDLAIDAMTRLGSVRPGCRLTFVGPDNGVPFAGRGQMHIEEYINARMRGAIHGGSVEWLGPRPPEQLADLRRRANVIVACSRYDNFPATVLEAMALGCPIVTADVGGIPEIIQHERNGLLCRPGDANDLADKILALLRNPGLAARLGAQAAIDAETRYHPDKIARQTLAYYQRVIDGRARG
jgi:glycosyltransferase involved in cell wall biosynthesis